MSSAWTSTSLSAALESLLLAADIPLARKDFVQLLGTDVEPLLSEALEALQKRQNTDFRGIHIVEVAGGYQLRTNPTYRHFVLKLYEAKPARLSRAALETLAIVAYRQPVTRAVIDDIRGVDSSGMLRKLQDLEFVRVMGQKDDIGRPNLYGTTPRFLEFFGLRSLEELPTLDDLDLEEFFLEHLPDEPQDPSQLSEPATSGNG